MELRALGTQEVSVFGLGCNNFGMRIDEDGTSEVVAAALDVGVTFFDTADSYATSEKWLGRALGGRRGEVVLATKFGSSVGGEPAGASPEYVVQACARSLHRLGTDWIDLYQLHKPDPNVPIAETIGALQQLVTEGKVRQIGCCNLSAAELDEAIAVAPRAMVSAQNRYNLLEQAAAAEVLDRCGRYELAFLAYYPLANGLLTGKYAGSTTPAPGTRIEAWHNYVGETLTATNLALVDRLSAWAGDHGRTVLELALAWLLAHEVVPTVIAGATSAQQVRMNQTDWRLDPNEVNELHGIVASAAAGGPSVA